MAICYPLSACSWLQNKWPWVPISRQNPFWRATLSRATFALARLSCNSFSLRVSHGYKYEHRWLYACCFRVRRSVQQYGRYDLFTRISRLLSKQRQLYVRHHRRPVQNDHCQISGGTLCSRASSYNVASNGHHAFKYHFSSLSFMRQINRTDFLEFRCVTGSF